VALACATVDIASLRRRLVYALHFIGRLLGMVDADHTALSGGAGRVGIEGAGGSQLSLDAAEGEEPEQEVEDGAHGRGSHSPTSQLNLIRFGQGVCLCPVSDES
jgi:hypothetical protein